MKILLLGATGRTGKCFLQEAITRGHQVHALVRNRSRLELQSPLLSVFDGLPTDMDALASAAEGCDVYVSALNISRTSDFPWSPLRTPPTLLSDTMHLLVQLARKNHTRIMTVSAWGVGETRQQIPGWFRWFIDNSNIGVAYADHARQEAILMQSGLPWTCIRPVGLVNGKKRKPVRVCSTAEQKPALTISRSNLAAFMISELEENAWPDQAIVVSS